MTISDWKQDGRKNTWKKINHEETSILVIQRDADYSRILGKPYYSLQIQIFEKDVLEGYVALKEGKVIATSLSKEELINKAKEYMRSH